MAIAKCVLPRPGIPARIREPRSVTKSGRQRRAEHLEAQRRLMVKLKSSIVFKNGKWARRVSRASRVCWRCAISSVAKSMRKSRYAHRSRSTRSINPARAARIREMQWLEEGIEIGVGGDHE